jgi:hypothetical protein
MRSLLFLAALSALLLGALISSGRAETDYQCLNLCVENGKNSASTCMSQCSYGQLDTKPLEPNHRVLETLQPQDPTNVRIVTKAIPIYTESKDYQCLKQCLALHMQYSACDGSCTVRRTKDGQIVDKYGMPVRYLTTSNPNPETINQGK